LKEGKEHKEIRELVKKINQAWLNGKVSELNSYFHDDMVIKGPALQELCRGRAACVKSYEEFLAEAKVLDYKEERPAVDVFSRSAVVVCPWQITYELAGKQSHEKGHDTLVFTRETGRWLVIWRLMLVDAENRARPALWQRHDRFRIGRNLWKG
jgi:ketosteroid isomerase-like protein